MCNGVMNLIWLLVVFDFIRIFFHFWFLTRYLEAFLASKQRVKSLSFFFVRGVSVLLYSSGGGGFFSFLFLNIYYKI